MKNRADIKKERQDYVDINIDKFGFLSRQDALNMFDFIDETVITYGVYLSSSHEQVMRCKNKSIKELKLHVRKLEKQVKLHNEKCRLKGIA